jgi:hypothetical protein
MRKYHAPFWSSGRRSDPPIDCNILAQALSESSDFLICAQCTSEGLGSLDISWPCS